VIQSERNLGASAASAFVVPRSSTLQEICANRLPPRIARMTAKEDIASVAGQLADLTRTVETMATELREIQQRATAQQERADIQQERIELAARELTDVSDRLQAAARALRDSV